MAGTDLVPVEDYAALSTERGGVEMLRTHLRENEISEFDLGRVKVPTGGATQWQVPTLEGYDTRETLQGVIVLSKNSRSYWETPYEEGEGNDPPDCSSNDAIRATKANDEIDIPAQREEESGMLLCDTCAYSEWGSSHAGGRGQACRMTRQLFLMVPEKMLPLVLSLPPTSLKPASSYFLGLIDYGIEAKQVITEIGLERIAGPPAFSKATFRMAGRLDPDQVAIVEQYAAALAPHFERVRVQDREEAGGVGEEAAATA